MRRLGYAVVDLVVERHRNRHREPVVIAGTPSELLAQLGGPIPNEPGDVDSAIAQLFRIALAHQQHGDHPRYFARVPGPSSFAAVLGDWLATGFNTIAASWSGGAGPSAVELIVVDWLRQLTGLPDGTEGVLVSGGSLANLTAIAAARAVCGPGVAYLTDQTHSCVVRDLRALGFAEDQVRVLPSDDACRMDVSDLRRAVETDRAQGRRPMLVIASAGTTNTGAVDPLPELADLCSQHDVWFHIDGAYGAPAAMTPQGRAVLAGMERADSLVVDPHKWLFQPYDVGCVLVRRPGALERAFTMNPEYLRDVLAADTGEVDFRNRSLELTRRSRAIKLWLTFRVYGRQRIQAAVQRGIERAVGDRHVCTARRDESRARRGRTGTDRERFRDRHVDDVESAQRAAAVHDQSADDGERSAGDVATARGGGRAKGALTRVTGALQRSRAGGYWPSISRTAACCAPAMMAHGSSPSISRRASFSSLSGIMNRSSTSCGSRRLSR
jgi:glutamate/tyrosine decarboxylase-like PLP-dependent enzyme